MQLLTDDTKIIIKTEIIKIAINERRRSNSSLFLSEFILSDL